MRKLAHATGQQDSQVDMTPMLDIVFIMLIFFIVTTSFVREVGLDVIAPAPDANNTISTTPSLTIHIDENGVAMLNNRSLDVERIQANVQRFLAENPVTKASVVAHPKARHGAVVNAINEIKRAGIQQVVVTKK